MAFKVLASLLLALVGTVQLANAAAVNKRATCAGGQTVSNEACCVLFPIMEDLQSEDLMDNECGDAAHGALRIAFHDAIGISKSAGTGGGADGSIVVFNATELGFHANTGIDDILDTFGPNIQAHPEISPGDYLQFANAVGLTNCPGAPRIQFFLGRPQPKGPSPGPDGLVPEPTDSVQTILARFADAGGFSGREVVALLASHSTAGADDVDPTRPGSAFDSTPDTFDTQFFVESLLRGEFFISNQDFEGEVSSSVRGTLRLESDHNLAHDSATACDWQDFALDHTAMMTEFGEAMVKLSLLGHDQSTLIDCSDVIPAAKPFNGAPVFPPSVTHNDVEQACATSLFPTLSTLPGPATSVPPIEQADDS